MFTQTKERVHRTQIRPKNVCRESINGLEKGRANRISAKNIIFREID